VTATKTASVNARALPNGECATAFHLLCPTEPILWGVPLAQPNANLLGDPAAKPTNPFGPLLSADRRGRPARQPSAQPGVPTQGDLKATLRDLPFRRPSPRVRDHWRAHLYATVSGIARLPAVTRLRQPGRRLDLLPRMRLSLLRHGKFLQLWTTSRDKWFLWLD